MTSCTICLMDYEPIRIRPVVGTCGHTLCEPCSKKIYSQCPKCREFSFLNPKVNYDLLELVENGGDSCCHKKFQSEIKKMEKKFSDTVKEVKDEHSSKIKSMKRELKQEFDTERQEMKLKIESMKNEFRSELDTVKQDSDTKYEGLKEEFQGIRQSLEERIEYLEERVVNIPEQIVIDRMRRKLDAVQKDTEMLKEELKDKRKRKGDFHSSRGTALANVSRSFIDLTGEDEVLPKRRKQALPDSNRPDKKPRPSEPRPSEPRPSNSDVVEPIDRVVAELLQGRTVYSERIYSKCSDDSQPGPSSAASTARPSCPVAEEKKDSKGSGNHMEETIKCCLKTIKCSSCKKSLPKYVLFRKDGVSVRCPNCKGLNIIGNPEKGKKYMKMNCDLRSPHFNQVPAAAKAGDRHNCSICGKQRILWVASDYRAAISM